jgi:hypothetical protein
MKGNESYINFFNIDKSNSALVNCKAIWVGNVGDLVISNASTGSSVVTFANVPSGTLLEIELKNGRVMSTDTTASNFVGLNW